MILSWYYYYYSNKLKSLNTQVFFSFMHWFWGLEGFKDFIPFGNIVYIILWPWCHHHWLRPSLKFMQMLSVCILWEGRDLSSTTPALTQHLSFCSPTPSFLPFSHPYLIGIFMPPRSKIKGHIVFVLSVILLFCHSVLLYET